MSSETAILPDLVHFLHSSPTPFHAVDSAIHRLGAAGFLPLSETASWTELCPGRYYVQRADSTLLAFVLPPYLAAGKTPLRGFRVIGAHTDSPNLRLKPQPEYVKEGCLQLGVEVYGGVLLNSWLDRDLSLAGRVIVRAGDGRLERRLLRIDRPLVRIPQLAIHLDREINDRGLQLNKQEHLAPLFAVVGKEGRARGQLTELCASELAVDPADIVTTELMLFDVTPPAVGGLSGELLFAPRLDNLAMCHAALHGLIRAAPLLQAEEGLVPLVVLFDHEEVGSNSAQGAASPLLPAVLERILLSLGQGREAYHRALAGSLCLSADMAHAVHPNYADRHEARHRPQLGGGPVIKVNSQQRYATCGRTAALFEELCRREEIKAQYYAHRTDLPCGSTIGPITATLLGIRTVDVGNPMLSMHSIRELCSTLDPEPMTRVMGRFLRCPDPF